MNRIKWKELRNDGCTHFIMGTPYLGGFVNGMHLFTLDVRKGFRSATQFPKHIEYQATTCLPLPQGMLDCAWKTEWHHDLRHEGSLGGLDAAKASCETALKAFIEALLECPDESAQTPDGGGSVG